MATLRSWIASVLISFFRGNHLDFTVTSEVLPGVNRSFNSFSAAAEEATLSRIFAGVHFRSDLTAGQRLGHQVADFVVDNFLTPASEKHDSGDDRWFIGSTKAQRLRCLSNAGAPRMPII